LNKIEIDYNEPLRNRLTEAMHNLSEKNRTHGVIQKGGKKYTEVFVRVEEFRKAFGTELGIQTEILKDEGGIVQVKANIIDKSNNAILGSGLAEEVRGSSNVNKTSALENCETSAIGRALASLGLHGGQYASANEIDRAEAKSEIIEEKKKEPQQPEPQPEPEAPKEAAPGEDRAIEFATELSRKMIACSSAKDLKILEAKNDKGIDMLKEKFPSIYNPIKEKFVELLDGFGEAPF
tara:strand:+ start:3944 stop:4651 length:708 start_codon:yes stop_codon:yes gene_type:complete